MAVLTADHILRKEPVFRQAVQRAAQAAASGALVTLGIAPTEPETGYGYIERGDAYQDTPLYRVKSFREKPDLATAERFLDSGRFFWNSGMFHLARGRYPARD